MNSNPEEQRNNLEEQSKRLSVRIALDGGLDLVGSGIVLACYSHNYALIFTAAHVIDKLEMHLDKKVHFCFADENDNQKVIEVFLKSRETASGSFEDNTGYFYKHPKYEKREDDYPINDGAIICFPYVEWMRGIPKFRICEIENGSAMLVGFPKKYNKPVKSKKDLKYTTYRGNIFSKSVKVVNQHNANLVVNEVGTGSWMSNSHDLDGLSGGGILTIGTQGLMFNGAFASTKINGKDTYYATASSVFLEIIDNYKLDLELPFNMESVRTEAAKCFDMLTDEKAHSWFEENADKYLKRLQHTVFFRDKFINASIFSCNEHRPTCMYYFINKLIGKVLIETVYKIDSCSDGEQSITIKKYDANVHIEHICSEKKIEQVVAETLINGAFSVQGLFQNGSVFIVSSKRKEMNEIISRGRCRRIISSIVDGNRTKFSDIDHFSTRIYNLLAKDHRENEYIGFSTLKGDLVRADIGFIGIGRLEEEMKETQCTSDKLTTKVKSLMESVWEVEE